MNVPILPIDRPSVRAHKRHPWATGPLAADTLFWIQEFVKDPKKERLNGIPPSAMSARGFYRRDTWHQHRSRPRTKRAYCYPRAGLVHVYDGPWVYSITAHSITRDLV